MYTRIPAQGVSGAVGGPNPLKNRQILPSLDTKTGLLNGTIPNAVL